MPITPPVCSPKIGSTATSCLNRFTIHFRRPPTLKQKNNYPYRGEYGFDWLRDEYIYPIEYVYCNQTTDELGFVYRETPLCTNVHRLRIEYQKDVVNPITPYGQDYYPAWLSIFAYGVKGNANSAIHKKGVYLSLQLDEIDPIANDGTEIIFRPGKACLKVTPAKIPISSFLATKKKSRTLGQRGVKINYYELVNAINIKCIGDTLVNHEEIKVFAKLKSKEVEVGKLMLYKNNIIPKADIFVINVITPDSAGNKQIPSGHDYFQYLYKYQSFNQALIRVEVKAGETFDLVELGKNPANTDVRKFLTRIMKGLSSSEEYYIDYLKYLYNKYGSHKPRSSLSSPNTTLKIDGDGHSNTYLLFTCINPPSDTLGLSTLDEVTMKWGNFIVLFQKGLKNDHTVVHEAGHTFSLCHTFEPSSLAIHRFHFGYTENYMDYAWKAIKVKCNFEFPDYGKLVPSVKTFNKYIHKMYSFYKWQWDLIRKDRSVRY